MAQQGNHSVMPNFSDIINEFKALNSQQRIQSVQRLIGNIQREITHRPLVVYAADLEKSHPAAPNFIYPLDKTMFADLLDSVGESNEIDVLIQSPGGLPDPAEKLVHLLRDKFTNVHFYVPHTAKSAATMIVCSGNKIFMDHRSELGPIDPQIPIPKGSNVILTVPARAYLDGFEQVRKMVEEEGKLSAAYIPVLNQVDVSTLQVCLNAIEHSKMLVRTWLKEYMFAGKDDAEKRAKKIADTLADEKREFLSHGRPIGIQQALQMGLEIEDLAKNPPLQSKIWELYCRIEMLFNTTPWVKIFVSESFMVGKLLPQVVIEGPLPPPPRVPAPRPEEQPKQRKRKKKR